MELCTMKLGLLVFSVLCSVSSVYGQVEGSFWWLNKNNTSTEHRENSGHIITTNGSTSAASSTSASSSTIAHASTGEEVWCTCVTWYLCENNTIITDGSGLLDIRSTAVVNVEECPLNEGDQKEFCCGSRPSTPPSTLTPIVTKPVWCECVSQNLCNNGVINSDGAGILDVRSGIRDNMINVEVCPNEADICCGTPPVDSTTKDSSVGNVTEATSTTSTSISITPTGAPHGGNTTSSATCLTCLQFIQILLIVTPFIVM